MDIRHLLTDIITVAPYVAANEYGEPGYGPQRDVAARVEVTRGVVDEGSTGAEARVSAVLVVAEQVGAQDRVWLPGADRGDAKQARVPGPDGVTQARRLGGGAVPFWEVRLV